LESFVELGRRHLDGDVAAETAVAGFVDLSHSAGADTGGDLVRADSLACRERHVWAVSLALPHSSPEKMSALHRYALYRKVLWHEPGEGIHSYRPRPRRRGHGH